MPSRCMARTCGMNLTRFQERSSVRTNTMFGRCTGIVGARLAAGVGPATIAAETAAAARSPSAFNNPDDKSAKLETDAAGAHRIPRAGGADMGSLAAVAAMLLTRSAAQAGARRLPALHVPDA